jgi:hypothetical protein
MSIDVLEEYPDKVLIKVDFFRERAVTGKVLSDPDRTEQKASLAKPQRTPRKSLKPGFETN